MKTALSSGGGNFLKLSGGTLTGDLTATNITLGASNLLSWTGRTTLQSSADGKLEIRTAAGTEGVYLDVQVDNTLKVFARTGGGYADISGKAISLSNGITVGAGYKVGFLNRTYLSSDAANKLTMANAAGNCGVLFDTTTDGRLKLRDRGDSVNANLSCGYLNASYSVRGENALADFATVALALTAGTMTPELASYGRMNTAIAKFSWTNAMVVALGAVKTGNVKVCTVPAKCSVSRAWVIISTAATVLSDLTISLGHTAADYTDWMTANDAKATAGTIYAALGLGAPGDQPDYAATKDVYVQFITTDGTNDLEDVLTCTGQVFLEYTILP